MSKSSNNAKFECLMSWLDSVKKNAKYKRRPLTIDYTIEPIISKKNR